MKENALEDEKREVTFSYMRISYDVDVYASSRTLERKFDDGFCDTFNRDTCGRTVSALLYEERKQDEKGVAARGRT